MTREEISDLLEKVRSYITNHNHHSYYVWYTPSSEEEWSANGSYVTFEVYAYSDQDDGREWTEDWFVDSDGKIGNGEETYDNYDDFKLNWL
jgi:hypothetical protein